MSRKIKFIIIFSLFLLLLTSYVLVKPYYDFLVNTLDISPLKTLVSDNAVKKVDKNVNILILGIAGGNHDGPNLSDSIIVATYNYQTNHLVTIGIPRDIWSDVLRDKINSAYAYGEAKQEDGGLKLARAEIGTVLGVPIQYSVVISFSKFKDLIDELNGISVKIERPFTDREFPIEGKENDSCKGDPKYRCRYETISFKKGAVRMDGITALKFVRSRRSEGDEGSDFARSQRQQLVLLAIKDKIIETLKKGDLIKLKKLYEKTDSLVNRDITNQELVILMKNIFLKKNFALKSVFLPEDLFMVPPYTEYNNKYVLVPKSGKYNEIHSYTQCLFEKEDQKPCLQLIKKGKDNK